MSSEKTRKNKKQGFKKSIIGIDYDRGRVERVSLKKPLTFNGYHITEAIIEIDHINCGLDRETYKLNTRRRTNFTLKDIEIFLGLLDDEYVSAMSYRRRKSRYEVRVDSPIFNKFYGKEFILVFETNYDSPHIIHTVTLFPNW